MAHKQQIDTEFSARFFSQIEHLYPSSLRQYRCTELSDWDLYAVDGHYQKAACFDPKTESSFGELRAIATGHFFRMDMRSHHMSCLGMSNPEDGKKKAHDMTVIKRSTADQLRNGAPKGQKVMLVWDKACIDYRHWFKLKHTYGIYFVTNWRKRRKWVARERRRR